MRRPIQTPLDSPAYDALWAAWQTVPKGGRVELVTSLLAAHFGLPKPEIHTGREQSHLLAELMRTGAITVDQVTAARASLAQKAAS